MIRIQQTPRPSKGHRLGSGARAYASPPQQGSLRRTNVDIELVVALQIIDDDGHHPAQREDADNNIAERAEVVRRRL
jgi:hypothetical protein